MVLDVYKILRISKTATASEIKTQFLKLAKLYHPDKNRHDPTTTKKFQDIKRAYDILSNESNRASYDNQMFQQNNDLRNENRYEHGATNHGVGSATKTKSERNYPPLVNTVGMVLALISGSIILGVNVVSYPHFENLREKEKMQRRVKRENLPSQSYAKSEYERAVEKMIRSTKSKTSRENFEHGMSLLRNEKSTTKQSKQPLESI